jgi:restriction system protein
MPPVPPAYPGKPCHAAFRCTISAVPPDKLWFVRAGTGGARAAEFRADSLFAIGWSEAGPIAADASDEEYERLFTQHFSDQKEGTRLVNMGVVKRFVRGISIGDGAITYDPDQRTYLLGVVQSEARWRDKHPLARYRMVSWTHHVARDILSVGTRKSLGSIVTPLLVNEEARDELWAAARTMGSVRPPAPAEVAVTAPADDGSIAEVQQDQEQRANDFIEDCVARLSWEKALELVAGILRAMGFRTRIADPGPDRGYDIFASPDGLGLKEPRVFVQVRHRKGAIGAPDIRSFLGGRKPGDRCVCVSTGGFGKDAQYEADSAAVPTQLVNLGRLRELLVEYYEQLDSATKAMVPLRRVYWPVE